MRKETERMRNRMSKKTICTVLAAAALLTGCSTESAAPEKPDSTVPAQTSALTEPESGQTAAETAAVTEQTEAEPVTARHEFNPHLYLPMLADDIPQEYWDAFYNLCDALRAGKTEFACASEAAYEWATDPSVLMMLFPAACVKVRGETADGSAPFADGTGHITYQMPAEEFVRRQADFERLVTEILDAYILPGDDDYMKCIKLFDYISMNYTYAYDYGNQSEDGAVYYTLTNRTGQCDALGSTYAYLLLQAGVQATTVGCQVPEMAHAWTYILLDGKGYHADVTWALREAGLPLSLRYFLMTGERRAASGCPVDDLTCALLPKYWSSRSAAVFSADDSTYSLPEDAFLDSLDEANHSIVYHTDDGTFTFSYAQN